MFAVVQFGSAQFKVSEGDIIEIDRLEAKKGKKITADKVLMFAKGNDVRIGTPYLKDVSVIAEFLQDTLGEKVIAYKYRRRKDSATKKGSRKRLSTLKISQISPK